MGYLDETATATADCSSGKKALGGGYLIEDYYGYPEEGPAATASYPSDDDTWTVSGRFIGYHYFGDWSIRAYVVCATIN